MLIEQQSAFTFILPSPSIHQSDDTLNSMMRRSTEAGEVRADTSHITPSKNGKPDRARLPLVRSSSNTPPAKEVSSREKHHHLGLARWRREVATEGDTPMVHDEISHISEYTEKRVAGGDVEQESWELKTETVNGLAGEVSVVVLCELLDLES